MKKKRNRKRRIKHSFGRRSKRLYFSVFTLLFSCLMVLGSTYAWFTSADEVTNRFEGSSFQIGLLEIFDPNFDWQPGKDTTKQIRVQNTGQTPALVRISLFEYLLTFQVDIADQTGNGNLKTAAQSHSPIVERKNTESWEAAASAEGTYESDGKFYIAKQAILSDAADGKGRYRLADDERQNSLLTHMILNFSATFHTNPPGIGTVDYWLYEDGYFYYSELLNPGEISSPLLDSVTLSSDSPNKMKGALYQLNPHLEAHDATSVISSEWGIGTSGSIYEMYKEHLK